MRRFVIPLVVLAMVFVFAASSSVLASLPGDSFRAPLSGGQENPAVPTGAHGKARFQLNAAGTSLAFDLDVFNIQNVFAAHIHCGSRGVNGPVGVTLFSGGPVSPDGTLASGNITAPDAGNGCGWTSLAQVVAAMQSRDTYVNVHTTAHPGGEIRGQILPVGR